MPSDEHERHQRYIEAVPLLADDAELLASFCQSLALDPDRVMSESVALAALTPEADSRVVASIAGALHDSDVVRRRVRELSILGRLADASYAGDPVIDLDGASGWLEERLAEQTGSVVVLRHLSSRASRRRARAEATRRLGAAQ